MVFVDRDAMHIGTTKSNNPRDLESLRITDRKGKGGIRSIPDIWYTKIKISAFIKLDYIRLEVFLLEKTLWISWDFQKFCCYFSHISSVYLFPRIWWVTNDVSVLVLLVAWFILKKHHFSSLSLWNLDPWWESSIWHVWD